MMAVVVDVNVPIVSNGETDQADLDCVEACLNALVAARDRCIIVFDKQQRILSEYRKYLSPSGQPGPGDLFMKWVWTNQANPGHCDQVDITARDGDQEDFEEFPDDPSLADFDRADRKYVAVVLASQRRPKILNASDTDWWDYRVPLQNHGVRVDFLCPSLMKSKK
jgi:hypothetical protein